jgi:tight adherence protein C
MIGAEIPVELLGLIALTIGALATVVWSLLGTRRSVVQERLDAITDPSKGKAMVSVIADDRPTHLWERILIALGRRQASGENTQNTRTGLRATLRYAGIRNPNAVYIVLGTRIVLMLAMAGLMTPLFLSGNRKPATFLFGMVLIILGYALPTLVVQRMAGQRKIRVTAALPDVLDLLVLCVESGLGLNAAIARVAEDRAETKDPLGVELAQLANEVRVGVPRRDALRNFADRTGSEDVRSLVAHLVQTERLGGNLGPALRAQSDSARATRKLRAEEIANRMPVKMLLPTVLFMPALFLVIFVPVALQAIEVLRGG